MLTFAAPAPLSHLSAEGVMFQNPAESLGLKYVMRCFSWKLFNEYSFPRIGAIVRIHKFSCKPGCIDLTSNREGNKRAKLPS